MGVLWAHIKTDEIVCGDEYVALEFDMLLVSSDANMTTDGTLKQSRGSFY